MRRIYVVYAVRFIIIEKIGIHMEKEHILQKDRKGKAGEASIEVQKEKSLRRWPACFNESDNGVNNNIYDNQKLLIIKHEKTRKNNKIK